MASRVVEESDHQQQQHVSMSMPISTPVGFRFAPTDIELIELYLNKRISSSCSLLPEANGLIVDFDIYSRNPWELPRHRFRYPSQQREMYFFTATRPPNSNGRSSNSSSKRCGRTAGCGVWHSNRQGHHIVKSGVVIGHTTAFKFEMIVPAAVDAGAEKEKGSNKRSNGNGSGRRKTDWLMDEYRLTSTHALVLCKIYEKKSREAAASSCRKQQQDHDQEEVEPLSVRPLAAVMPSWIVSAAYSDAPDHIIQVPKLMMKKKREADGRLPVKRRRLEFY